MSICHVCHDLMYLLSQVVRFNHLDDSGVDGDQDLWIVAALSVLAELQPKSIANTLAIVLDIQNRCYYACKLVPLSIIIWGFLSWFLFRETGILLLENDTDLCFHICHSISLFSPGAEPGICFFFIIRGGNHANLYKNLIKIQIFNVNLGAIGGPGPCPPPLSTPLI